jgi:hypothetical protein
MEEEHFGNSNAGTGVHVRGVVLPYLMMVRVVPGSFAPLLLDKHRQYPNNF